MGDLAGKPRLLARGSAEGTHQTHIAHHIGDVAADRCCTASIALVQMMAALREIADDDAEKCDDGEQDQGYLPVDESQHANAADDRHGRRDRHPG